MLLSVKRARFSFSWHLALLVVFCVVMLGVWMVPVLLAGFPYWISGLIPSAREFAQTGVLTEDSMRLVMLIVAALHPLIDWQNVTGWAAVSAAAFAASLIPLWWSIFRLFNTRMAWLSTIVISFMPMYWAESLRLEGYTFAFFFLFLSFALFIELFKRKRVLAVVLSALCFGAVLASRFTFITFLPWFIAAYVWQERRHWKRAFVEVGLFCLIVYIAFALPLLPNALQGGMSLTQRIEVFLPSLEDRTPGEGHLYPDEYTYTYHREEFNELIKQRVEQSSFLERQMDQHYRLIFGVGDMNFFVGVLNGFWLFANILPPLFLQDTVGGVFLWLFIIPGIVFLYRHRRRLLWQLLGLWLSMEFLLRFILHFGRDHLIDVGWMIALFAALGIVSLGTALQKQSKRLSLTAISIIVIIIVSAQLTQANRKLFARLYTRSTVPEIYAAIEALKDIPADSIVANPRRRELFYFSDRKPVTIHDGTIDYLAGEGRLREPFEYYGVTHILGYTEERTRKITGVVRGIEVVTLPPSKSVPLTPFIRLLLHVVR